MAATVRTGHPPRTLYTLLEGRGLVEMALLPAWLPLLQATPRGDGHTVLLVPGFTASDATRSAVSDATSLHMADSVTYGRPASRRRAAL